MSIIGDSTSFTSNQITIHKSHPHHQDTEFSLDTTPTDVDIHLIWNQIRENLRKSNNAVTTKKFSNSDSIALTHRPRMLTKRQPKINRVNIGLFININGEFLFSILVANISVGTRIIKISNLFIYFVKNTIWLESSIYLKTTCNFHFLISLINKLNNKQQMNKQMNKKQPTKQPTNQPTK